MKPVAKYVLMYGCSLLLLLPVRMLSQTTNAADPASKKKWFYAGFEMGAGDLDYKRSTDTSHAGIRLAMDLNIGVSWKNRLRAGIHLNGWTIETFGSFDRNPERGISVSNVFGSFSVRPFTGVPLWFQIMAGRSLYTNNHPGAYKARGPGFLAGIRYDLPLGKKKTIFLSSSCNYGAGKLKELEVLPNEIKRTHRYTVVELKTGVRAVF